MKQIAGMAVALVLVCAVCFGCGGEIAAVEGVAASAGVAAGEAAPVEDGITSGEAERASAGGEEIPVQNGGTYATGELASAKELYEASAVTGGSEWVEEGPLYDLLAGAFELYSVRIAATEAEGQEIPLLFCDAVTETDDVEALGRFVEAVADFARDNRLAERGDASWDIALFLHEEKESSDSYVEICSIGVLVRDGEVYTGSYGFSDPGEEAKKEAYAQAYAGNAFFREHDADLNAIMAE